MRGVKQMNQSRLPASTATSGPAENDSYGRKFQGRPDTAVSAERLHATGKNRLSA